MLLNRHLPFQLSVLMAAMLASVSYAAPAEANAPGTDDTTLPTIQVVATADEASSEQTKAYTVKDSSSATRLNISTQETPQTINVVTRQQLDDYAINNLRDVLRATPGITVNNQETDRTSYMARGFEISNVLVDGVGFPLGDYNYQNNNPDTFLFDRIEVVKGADALTTAFGDPSATINMIRKRPTKDLQASVNLSYGSWDTVRTEVDASGSVLDGRLRARIMGYEQTGDSYLDRYSLEKNGFAAIVEADITDTTTLMAGYSETNSNPNATNWGAMPLQNSDGDQLSYDRGYNYSPDWTYWDYNIKSFFGELSQKLWGDWQAKLSYDEKQTSSESKLLYLSGVPSAVDNTSGVYLWPGIFNDAKNVQRNIDANIQGTFPLFGQRHEAIVGYNWSTSTVGELGYNGTYADHLTTDLSSWTPPEPVWDSVSGAENQEHSYQKNQSIYAATRLHLTDDLKLTLGTNYVQATSKGLSYDSPVAFDEHKVAPYAGITYNISPEYTAYASYTSIFRPQTTVDVATGQVAKPIDGESYEIGVKSAWLDNALTGTFAIFRTEESNYPLRSSDGNPTNHKVPVSDLRSQGVDFSLAGQLSDNLNVSFGFTQYSLTDLKNGGKARTYNPDRTISLLTTYQMPVLPKLKVGAGLSWQGGVYSYNADLDATLRQGAYALVDLMASYDINDHISVQANGYNLGNKKYLFSFQDGQAFYGAPANYMLSLKLKY